MKTFETEKHNIPEGATHYSNEEMGEYFCWYKDVNGKGKIMLSDGRGFSDAWWDCEHNEHLGACVKPIPQANIETPEKKEALDNLPGISHKYLNSSESPNGSNDIVKPLWAKWSIGDTVTKTKGSSWTGKVVGYYQTDLTSKGYAVESSTEKGSVQIYPEAALCDFETPQQREEREELEAAYDLYLIGNDSFNLTTRKSISEFKVDDFQRDFWLAIVDKTNYRKEW